MHRPTNQLAPYIAKRSYNLPTIYALSRMNATEVEHVVSYLFELHCLLPITNLLDFFVRFDAMQLLLNWNHSFTARLLPRITNYIIIII